MMLRGRPVAGLLRDAAELGQRVPSPCGMFAKSPSGVDAAGSPSTVRSGCTSMRPPRPCGSPAGAASGAAVSPPPQTTRWVRIAVPSLSVTWSGATSVGRDAQPQLDAAALQLSAA